MSIFDLQGMPTATTELSAQQESNLSVILCQGNSELSVLICD